jgi:16S rRNA (guanine1207-N2)-methyltransferase
VFNSGLAYQAELTRRVGPTRVAGRDPKFTVTASTRR